MSIKEDVSLWNLNSSRVLEKFHKLQRESAELLVMKIREVAELKKSLASNAETASAALLCAKCGGECCLFGKYHFTALDLLTAVVYGIDPVIPNFANHPLCPYGSLYGCRLEPFLRPLNCIIFNCENLENKIQPDILLKIADIEQLLRIKVAEISELFGERIDRPLLLASG